MDGAFEISLILPELLEKGLKLPKDTITELANAILLRFFLDDPQDTVDHKMLRVLSTLKRWFKRCPSSFNAHSAAEAFACRAKFRNDYCHPR